VAGTTAAIAIDWTGLAAFSAQLRQNGTTNYGGWFGVNYAFQFRSCTTKSEVLKPEELASKGRTRLCRLCEQRIRKAALHL
jgi:hypothetical protein